MKKGQATTAKTAATGETKATVPPAIELRLEQGYIVARYGDVVQVFELVWESHHGDPHKRLVLRECVTVPRQFEREVYGERGS